MTSPEKKSPCLKRGENMEVDTPTASGDSNDADEEVDNFSNFTGVKLIYFEHSYVKNYVALCEMYENSKSEAEKAHATLECVENQVPVRRSQRQINKSDILVSVDMPSPIQSPVKSKICMEEKSKENIDLSKSNITVSNSPIVSPIKNKIQKNENKPIIGDVSVNNTKINHKSEVIQELSPSKILKKAKMSEPKVILKKEEELDLKHKVSEKDGEISNANVDLKKKENMSMTHTESRRKRAYSEPSKNDTYSTGEDNESKEIIKSKKARGLTKQKNPLLKTKKVQKLNMDSNKLKKRKRNMSAPSDKIELTKNEKLNDTNKGKRKMFSLSQDPTSKEPIKLENKKNLSVENKTSVTKGFSSPTNTVLKPKFKKTTRRESLRLVINEDEPPLFSQPDVMVKVKSDDSVKKEEKSESDLKHQVQNVSSSETSSKNAELSENVPNVELDDNKTPEIINKLSETSNELENTIESLEKTIEEGAEDPQEKEVFKDLDSENSLHIDESIGKIFESENDENLKNEHNESISNYTEAKEDTSKDLDEENASVELVNTNLSQTVKMEDPDSDKPIAERKPRRIIKKKEFFEDIATRSSAQTKKSVGKQKANGDKKSSEEDSKHGKRKSTCKSEVESEDSSEDDPLKLWCICRQPHNDRFMIQCDKCEDWFHGSCVGVSRQQGRKLEKQQKEWICPNCVPKAIVKMRTEDLVEKKYEPEGKKIKVEKEEFDEKAKHQINPSSRKEKNGDKINKTQMKSAYDRQNPLLPSSTSQTKSDVDASSKLSNKKNFNKNHRTISKVNDSSSNIKKGLREPIRKKQNCVSCQAIASVNSCYCSDKCLEKHAADCLAIMQEGKGSLKGSEFDSQRIVVLDRVKGNVLAGDNAPTAGNIISWLKANPSYMIACSSGSSSSSKHSVQKKEGDTSAAGKDKKEMSDDSSKATVRCNVRKTLKNILMDRCKNADDIQLPEDDVRKIAVKIEEELHSLFKDNSFKYRAKYRSLMFNIKDPRNQGLFRKILKGNIPPDKLVRMSPEELASVELAKWREQENQHLLDMIKRVQLEQQSGSGLLLKKTHKGEVEIEDDFGVIDDIPKTTPTKIFSGEPAEVEKPEPDKEVAKDTTFHHRSHLFDLNCKICTGKILPPPAEESTPKKIRVAHSISVDLSSPAALDPVEKTVSRIVDGKSPLSSTGDDSMDQEPTSTVSIGSPEISMRFTSDSEISGKVTSSVWKGFIYMQDVAKFVTCAYKVSGQTEYLHMDVPDTIQVCGRIIPDQVWDYLGKIKQSGNKELIIIRFQAANEEETVTYNSFYSYLSSRKRYGVVSNYSKKIKDFYILPLAATSPVPIVLMPFDGPGLPSPRPHLLLGVIVRHKMKQTGPPVAKKEKCKEDIDRLDGSYTPPLDTRSYTPPLPTVQSDNSVNITPDTVFSSPIDTKSSVPSEESDITQNSIESSTDTKSKESEIYEPSYTPPLQILPSDSPKDEDKPYDPEQDILNIGTDKKDVTSSPKQNVEKGTENLEKHKKILDALTRQVEETDRQVNALKHLISHPDDSDAEYQSPSTQTLDINSVTATGMSSFLDLPENLQDILNVVREKSLDKEKLSAGKGDVDMRINSLFSKSFNNSAYQTLNESSKVSKSQEKNGSRGATPPPEDSEENSSTLVRPSDPRIKIRTSFQESSYPPEEPANVSLSNMSVTELVERAEKELAEMEALEKTSTQSAPVNQEKVDIDKMSSNCWNQYKEPPPPGIEPSDLTSEDSTYSSKTISSTSTTDNSLPSSYSSPLIQEAQQVGPHFPPPFPPPLPPGFSIQTPPPNIKNFPPPNVIPPPSFPPPPLPIVTKPSDVNPVNEAWPAWNIPPQQSKDNNWQNRVPQWDDNWKNTTETATVDCSEGSSHYFPPGTHDFNKDQFYRGESSSEGRWNRPHRFGRNNWPKRPVRGGRWRGKRSFHFNKNQRN